MNSSLCVTNNSQNYLPLIDKDINRNARDFRYYKARYRYLVSKGEIIPLTEEQKNEHKRLRYKPPAMPHTTLKYPTLKDSSNKVSRAYGAMTQVQKDKLVELMSKGIGRIAACDEVGVTLPVFNRTCVQDHEFRDKVIHQDARIDEILDDIVWIKAVEEKDASAALSLRRLRLDIKNRESARRNDKAKIIQKDRELDIKEKSCNVIASSVATSNINVSSLSTPEMDRYLDLMSRASVLSPEEHTEFGALTAKMYAQPASLDVQSNGHQAEAGVKALNGLSRIDQEFNDEDEGDE
jgi:hypothetical protein